MRLASGTVLLGATVTASPALYKGLVTGELPTDVALTRYLVALVLVWGALSLLAMLVGPTAVPAEAAPQEPAADGSGALPGSPG